jgi:hypothetical protein
VPGQGVERENPLGRRQERIPALLRSPRGVRGQAPELGVQLHGGQEPRGLPRGQRLVGDVERREDVDVVDDAGGDHGPGATPALLRGLEDQPEPATPPVSPRQELGDPEADRHVAVVPAGVHDALSPGRESLCRRAMVARARLGDLGRVHVEPERDGGSRTAIELADDARPAPGPGGISGATAMSAATSGRGTPRASATRRHSAPTRTS